MTNVSWSSGQTVLCSTIYTPNNCRYKLLHILRSLRSSRKHLLVGHLPCRLVRIHDNRISDERKADNTHAAVPCNNHLRCRAGSHCIGTKQAKHPPIGRSIIARGGNTHVHTTTHKVAEAKAVCTGWCHALEVSVVGTVHGGETYTEPAITRIHHKNIKFYKHKLKRWPVLRYTDWRLHRRRNASIRFLLLYKFFLTSPSRWLKLNWNLPCTWSRKDPSTSEIHTFMILFFFCLDRSGPLAAVVIFFALCLQASLTLLVELATRLALSFHCDTYTFSTYLSPEVSCGKSGASPTTRHVITRHS